MRAGTEHVADANRRRHEMCHFWITERKIPAHPLPGLGDIEMAFAACAFSWLLLIKNKSSKPNKGNRVAMIFFRIFPEEMYSSNSRVEA